MDFLLLQHIEDFQEFLFVDELYDALAQRLGKENVTALGESAEGHPLFCGKLGHGKENALIFGFPHPNEPVGSLTCLSLVTLIQKNKSLQERFTWYIIPCADPDGAKLNEGWFKGKFSIKKYAYHFYRSKPSLQTDWSFPVKYKDYVFNNPPANVRALQQLIEKIKPRLVYPLHNAGFGGAYFFVTPPVPELFFDDLITLCHDLAIPMDLGEPEAPFIQELKKPVFKDISFSDYYEYYKKAGIDPTKILDYGTTSIDFARQYHKRFFGLVGEIPYIYDEKIADEKQTQHTRKENNLEVLTIHKENLTFIEEVLQQKNLNKQSLFYTLIETVVHYLKNEVKSAEITLEKPEYQAKATVAETFNTQVIIRFYASLILGELRRLLLASPHTKENILLQKKIEERIDVLIASIEKYSTYKILPLKKLVQLQLGCLLIAIDYLST
ncbi:MAG: M14 family zinc carboxypeptidase [Nanoarchaeota archaeon]